MIQSYLLEIEGKPVGRLISADTPAVKAEIISSVSFGAVPKLWKGMPQVLSDITVKFGTGMARAFYEWVSGPNNIRKNGAIVGIDLKGTEVRRFEFFNALVTSFTLPELDSSSKSTAFFTASFKPEQVNSGVGGGKAKVGVYVSGSGKLWNAANFKFTISGLEKDTSAITKIGAFGSTQTVKAHLMGDSRSPDILPISTSHSNLTVTLPTSSANAIMEWATQIATADNATSSRKQGVLEYYAPDKKTAYFSVELSDLMVSSTTLAKSPDNLSSRPVTIEMFFDSMKFSAHSAAVL